MAIFDFFKKNNLAKRYILGMLLKEKEIILIVFKESFKGYEIYFIEKLSLIENWQGLVENLDLILTKIDQKIGSEIKETIFFLYSHFITNGESYIKSQYLNKIKEIVKNLDLKPLGYVEVVDCVSLYFTNKDNIPLTAVIIEVEENYISLFIFKGGKIFLKKTINKSANFIKDIEEVLNNKEKNFLIPTRIILYNGKNLDECSLKIINHQWPEDLFIQNPKVDIIKEEELLQSLSFTLNNQLTAENQFFVENEELKKQEKFGFLINKDIGEKEKTTVVASKEKKELRKNFLSFFVDIKNKFNFLINIISIKRLSFLREKISSKLLFFIALSFIFSLLIINEYFFHTAEISLFFPKKLIQESISLDLNYSIASNSVNIKEEKETTGKKIIGEKARGKIIVYNTNLIKEKNIDKGTRVKINNLEFIFDEPVKIATAQSATNPGSTITSLLAADIGEEYNIKKGTKLNIDENSNAESIENFSGGIKKEIRTISSSDITTLEEIILKKAKTKNILKAKKNEIKLSDLKEAKIQEKKINGEIGEELDKVEMEAKILITDFFVNEDDLKNKILEKSKSKISSGFKTNNDLIKYQIEKIKLNNAKVNLQLKTKINLVADVDINFIQEKINSKSVSYLNSFLNKEIKPYAFELKNKNLIPFLNFYLPVFKNNIKIKISSNY